MPKRFAKCLKHGFYTALYLFIFAIIASCGGGGGGGGGVVSFAPDSNMPHNGGDAGGWGTGTQTGGGFGGSNIGDDNTTLLIGQIAALDVENINIVLYVNGERFEINNVTETTTKEVLPEMSVGDIVYGTAYISVAGENDPREAPLDQTTIGFNTSLKFKVPYNYTITDNDLSVPVSGTYFARDGIDLSAYTTGSKVGWECSAGQTSTICYGAHVTGVRGDITLSSIKESLWVDDDGALHFDSAVGSIPSDLVIPSNIHGKTVRKIAANAFQANTSITSVTIPDGIIVESYAFDQCLNLQSANIGNNVTLNDSAFGACGTNTSGFVVNIGNGVIYNGGCVFGYSKIRNISFTNAVFPLGFPAMMFTYCLDLDEIRIPSGVQSIGTSCFSGATFNKVYIPKSVKVIESYAFDQADGEIYYQGTTADWADISIDNVGDGNSRLGSDIPIHYESW